MPPDLKHEAPLRNQRGFLVRLELQKRSALKFASRTIPVANGLKATIGGVGFKPPVFWFKLDLIGSAKLSILSIIVFICQLRNYS